MAKRKNPHAVALGRKGGQSTSPAKLAAIKLNAQKAGRKPKFVIGDIVRANDKAPGDYEDRIGIVTEIGPRKSEFKVEYRDGGQPFGYLMSWWLDLLAHLEEMAPAGPSARRWAVQVTDGREIGTIVEVGAQQFQTFHVGKGKLMSPVLPGPFPTLETAFAEFKKAFA